MAEIVLNEYEQILCHLILDNAHNINYLNLSQA